MVNILCLDCSTVQASVALYKDNNFFAEEVSLVQRGHSEFMTVAIEKLLKTSHLKLSQIDLIAVTYGPGSFTGIRVAVGLAKTLSYSLQIPIWGIDTLSVLRAQADHTNSCFVALNAYKNLLFGSYFSKDIMKSEPQIFTFADANLLIENHQKLDKIQLIGDGILLLGYDLDPNLRWPRSAILGKLAIHSAEIGQTYDWKSLIPLYIRGSEAEENLRLKNSEK